MPMFDPYYINEVLADILSRKTGGTWEFTLTPKEPEEKDGSQKPEEKPA